MSCLDKSILWSEFYKNPEEHKYKIINIYNDDFKYGTIRIKYPCTIKLQENIIFNPDNGDNSNPYFEPSLSTRRASYSHHGYILGFFAAITVECPHVTINLNNFEIRQSAKHYLLQRFYAHIELADQPFIPKQGPGDFGDTIDSAEHCIIKNGTFGLSSHHSVHGNNNRDITIHDVNMHHFEVAGVALNGCINYEMNDCNIDGKFNNIPVLGIFSAAVFLRIFVKHMIKYATKKDAVDDLTNKLNELENAINYVIKDVIHGNHLADHYDLHKINPDRKITKIFINESGIVDGTTYGMLIHGKGVAVNAFKETKPDTYLSKNVVIKNVNIKNIIGNTQEILALSSGIKSSDIGYSKGGVQTDTAGAVFQIITVLDNDGSYKGNVVSDMQISVARWSDEYLDCHDHKLAELKKNGRLGTLNIHPTIVAWAVPGIIYNGITNKTHFSQVMEISGFKYLGNGDTMFHVNKGFYGIRMDSVDGITINCNISNIIDKSNIGSDIPGKYTGALDGGHLNQGSMVGYTGAQAFGIHFSACDNIKIYRSKINCIHSNNGSAYGVYNSNETTNVELYHSNISCIKSNSQHDGSLPNILSSAIGIYTDSTSSNVHIAKSKVKNTRADNCLIYAQDIVSK
jgi:hypothetical protein